jgi:ubiquinone/menaquinone biosynthesis C-methylase UbiE
MNGNPRAEFFDVIADKWDGWECLTALRQKFVTGLDAMGVNPDETVLDVGCGTGNLTSALLTRLSATGRVIAVDISPRMIEVARHKVCDERVAWHTVDASRLPLSAEHCDLSLPRFRGHVVYAASAPSRRSASTSFGVL